MSKKTEEKPRQKAVQSAAASQPEEKKDINGQYLYCSIRLPDCYDDLYYISTDPDIAVDDDVLVPLARRGSVEGTVVFLEWFTEECVPYPVKKTKLIERIVKRASEKRQKKAEETAALFYTVPKQPFVRDTIDPEVTAVYDRCVYFASAVFRGFETDIQEALRLIEIEEDKTFGMGDDQLFNLNFLKTPDQTKRELRTGISQFECPSKYVLKIVQTLPRLKGLFFAEDWNKGEVYLAYSESGYDTVTSCRLIGPCDFYCRDRWSLIHDPAEPKFPIGKRRIVYRFTESSAWEKLDYVTLDGSTRLAGKEVIPSQPYPKRTSAMPARVIEIHYPENEVFYTPPVMEKKKKAKNADGNT